jgi:hypothetical protein
MKTCGHCGEAKLLTAFYRSAAGRDGRRPECIPCTKRARAERYHLNRDAAIARVRRWREENPEKYAALRRRQRESGAKAAMDRKSHLKRKYGMTVEEYDEMFRSQGGVCAICGAEPTPGISLHVDHCHETGAIRGLCCFRCNNALGDFGHGIDRLRGAITYLDRHDADAQEMAEIARERARALVTS